jgi:hypothetical protein
VSVTPVHSPPSVKDKSAQGMGGALAWPALLRKFDKLDPGYKL